MGPVKLLKFPSTRSGADLREMLLDCQLTVIRFPILDFSILVFARMFRDGRPGNANLLIGVVLPANQEIGVPVIGRLRHNRFKGLRPVQKTQWHRTSPVTHLPTKEPTYFHILPHLPAGVQKTDWDNRTEDDGARNISFGRGLRELGLFRTGSEIGSVSQWTRFGGKTAPKIGSVRYFRPKTGCPTEMLHLWDKET